MSVVTDGWVIHALKDLNRMLLRLMNFDETDPQYEGLLFVINMRSEDLLMYLDELNPHMNRPCLMRWLRGQFSQEE